MKYRVTPSRKLAIQLADQIWRGYQAAECAHRGLPPGSSLDLCAGQVATPTTVRKIEPIESEDGTAWAVPIDEDAERYVGARVTDVLPSALPAKLRAIFDGASERMRTRG